MGVASPEGPASFLPLTSPPPFPVGWRECGWGEFRLLPLVAGSGVDLSSLTFVRRASNLSSWVSIFSNRASILSSRLSTVPGRASIETTASAVFSTILTRVCFLVRVSLKARRLKSQSSQMNLSSAGANVGRGYDWGSAA